MDPVEPLIVTIKDEPSSPEEIVFQNEEYSHDPVNENNTAADASSPYFRVEPGETHKRTAEATTFSPHKLPKFESETFGAGPSRVEFSNDTSDTGIYPTTKNYSADPEVEDKKEGNKTSSSEASWPSDETGDESEEEVEDVKNSAEAVTLTTDGSFFKLVANECTDTSIVALCVMCQPTYVRVNGSPESTERFRAHLLLSHGKYVLGQYDRYISKHLSKETSDSEGQKKQLQEAFDTHIAQFILHSLVPLEIVENPFFNTIFKFLNVSERGLSVPSKQALERRIVSFYKRNLRFIKEELEKTQHVCISTDIWRCGRTSYFGVAVHFLNEQMQRESAVIACEKFTGKHSYDKLSEWLAETQGLYGLTNSQIVASMTNSGFNYAEAFQKLGVDPGSIKFEGRDDGDTESDEAHLEELQFVDINEIIKKGQLFLPNRSSCAAQTLILCASIDFVTCLQQYPILKQVHDRVMNKCNTLWQAAGKVKNEKTFQNILGFALPRPDERRWNSLYDALKAIHGSRNKIEELIRELSIKKSFCESDFKYISEFLTCTKPLTVAVEIIQSENEYYYGVLFPTILSLQRKLHEIASKSLIFCEPLAKSYLNSVTTRFSKFINFSSAEAERAAVATMSYPRFKRKWFVYVDEKYYERLTSLLRKNVLEYMNVNPIYSVDSKDDVWSKDDFFDFGSSASSKLSIYSKADDEIALFFNDTDEDITMLNRYENVRKVFVKFNTPLASSAPVEQLFPFTTLTNSPHVNRLSNGMFEKRVILRANLLKKRN
ncbi:unnamed protein product [Bemisia tabaci]|uniref:Uncharacterized protein n=1 Tax=Bemisia tabaci TaxID=7038 RepID=A0A9P0F6P2_BEMTA|nr:unnamed protein product [Bemisia tabaci]